MRVRVDETRQHHLSARIDRVATAELLATASAVSTARISVPSIATAPFATIRPVPSMVTTVPPLTTSDICLGAFCAATATSDPRRPPRQSRIRIGGFAVLFSCAVAPIQHPVVHDALVELRDTRAEPPAFRRAANRISVLLAAEALRTLPTKDATVVTPLGPASDASSPPT